MTEKRLSIAEMEQIMDDGRHALEIKPNGDVIKREVEETPIEEFITYRQDLGDTY